MRKRDTVEIGDFKYEVTQLGANEGKDGLLKIQKLMGASNGDVGEAINAMSTEDLNYFCKIFAAQTRLIVEKTNTETGEALKPVAKPLSGEFENHFAGDMLFDMLQWLIYCVSFNFGFFFARLTTDTELIKRIQAKAMPATSSVAPIGESGGS